VRKSLATNDLRSKAGPCQSAADSEISAHFVVPAPVTRWRAGPGPIDLHRYVGAGDLLECPRRGPGAVRGHPGATCSLGPSPPRLAATDPSTPLAALDTDAPIRAFERAHGYAAQRPTVTAGATIDAAAGHASHDEA